LFFYQFEDFQMANKLTYDELRKKLEECTAEINKTNKHLDKEIKYRKAVERALREGEERYRLLFENAGALIQVFDKNGICKMLNETAARYYEGAPGDFIGKSFHDLRLEAANEYLERNRKILNTGVGQIFDELIKLPSGRERWFLSNAQPIRDAAGNIFATQIISQDITERRNAENALMESEERYRLLAENVSDVIWTIDMNMNLTYVSPSVNKMRGYTADEVITQKLDEILTPESVKVAKREYLRAISGEETKEDLDKSYFLEVEQKCKDGSTIWTELNVTFLRDSDGQPTGFIGVTRDISKRKKAEDALRESEKEYRNLFDSIPDPVAIVHENLNILFNQTFTQIFGYDHHDLEKGLTLIDMIPNDDDKEIARNRIEGRLLGKKIIPEFHNVNIINKQGGIIPCEVKGTLIQYNGRPADLVILRDITERKHVEETLRESEGRYRLLAENVTDVIWTADMNLKFTYISPSVKRLRGYSVDEALAQTMEEVMTPTSFETVMITFNEALKEGKKDEQKDLNKSYVLELELNCKDSSTVWTEIKVSFLRDTASRPIGIIGVTRDISERKRSEEARRETEEKYRMLIDNYDAPITVYDREGTTLMMNRAAAKWVGKNPEDLIGKGIREYLASEADLMINRFRSVIDSEKGADFEDMLELPSGKRWFWSNLQPVKDINGKTYAVQTISYDITERNQAKEALEKSEERLALALQATTDGIWDWNILKNEAYVSQAFKEMLGIKEDIAILVPFDAWTSRIHPDHYDGVVRQLWAALEGKTPYNVEYLVRNETGEYRWHNARGMALFNEEGKAFRMVGSIRDIHERMEKEEHIRSLTQQLIMAQEIEWKRISRELHDYVAQDLAASKVASGLLLTHKKTLSDDLRQNITNISNTLDKAIKAVRDLAYNLRPQDLEELGLIQSVFRYCEDFSEMHTIGVDFHYTGIDSLRLSFEAEINIFRLIQEALNNIKKHADARHATVRIVGAFPNIILRIEDDGKGFDVEKRLASSIDEKRMGLRNMEERVILLHGQMKIHSKPEVGTIISIRFPYKENKYEPQEDHINP